MKKSKSESKEEGTYAGLTMKEYDEKAAKIPTVRLPLSDVMGDPTIQSMMIYLDGQWVLVINSEYSA